MRKNGLAVLVAGFIALEGTAKLADIFSEQINKKYPPFLARQAKGFADSNEATENSIAAIVKEHGLKLGLNPGEDYYMTIIREGGFLTALWNVGKESDMGMDLDLRKVPLKQETIEICELCEVNPYHLLSGGSAIIIAPEGHALMQALQDQGIHAVIIGSTNSGKGRVLHNDGTESYLNRPEPDEIEKYI